MASTFTLEVATPEKLVVSAEATEATVPGSNGMLGILPGHAPLISEIDAGVLTYTTDEQKHTAVVTKGWVEVTQERVRILVDTCETANEIDVARAEEAFKRATERLSSPKEGLDMARALNAAKRAQARLDFAKSRGN